MIASSTPAPAAAPVPSSAPAPKPAGEWIASPWADIAHRRKPGRVTSGWTLCGAMLMIYVNADEMPRCPRCQQQLSPSGEPFQTLPIVRSASPTGLDKRGCERGKRTDPTSSFERAGFPVAPQSHHADSQVKPSRRVLASGPFSPSGNVSAEAPGGDEAETTLCSGRDFPVTNEEAAYDGSGPSQNGVPQAGVWPASVSTLSPTQVGVADYPLAQCSNGLTQSTPLCARTVKGVASARQTRTARQGTARPPSSERTDTQAGIFSNAGGARG